MNRIASLFLLFVTFWGCNDFDSASDDLNKLLALQKLQQEAHLNEDAELLVSMFAEDFMSIDSGTISKPTKQQSINRFQRYFDEVEFVAWENIEAPVIQISQDGSMAYIAVLKRVQLKIPQPDGEMMESEANFAWMEAWEKMKGEWKMKAIASTDNQ